MRKNPHICGFFRLVSQAKRRSERIRTHIPRSNRVSTRTIGKIGNLARQTMLNGRSYDLSLKEPFTGAEELPIHVGCWPKR
jgi:hypothetical protein